MSSTQACRRSLAYCSHFDSRRVAVTLRVRAGAREPFGVAEARGLAAGFDVGEGLSHAAKAERVEFIEGRIGEQDEIA